MDQFPNEIIEKILIHVGGLAFVKFRCTQKRLKSIADYMEMQRQFSVWYRFTMDEFPLWAIQSLIPWMKIGDCGDSVTWKRVYIVLTKSKGEKNVASTFSIPTKDFFFREYNPRGSPVFDIKFVGTHLCVCSRQPYLLGVHKPSDPNKIFPITDARHSAFQKVSLIRPCFLFHEYLSKELYEIIARPLNISDQKSAGVSFFRESIRKTCNDCYRSFDKGGCWMHYFVAVRMFFYNDVGLSISDHQGHLERKKVFRVDYSNFIQSADVDEERVWMMTTRQELCMFTHQAGQPYREYKQTLPGKPLRFQLLEDAILCLYDNLGLGIFKVAVDDSLPLEDKISIGPWQELVLPGLSSNRAGLVADKVVDFSVHGNCLAVATRAGKIFIGHPEDWNKWKFSMPYQMQLHHDGFLTTISLDTHTDLTVAALEAYTHKKSRLFDIHLLFYG